jgi:hypothetical protein
MDLFESYFSRPQHCMCEIKQALSRQPAGNMQEDLRFGFIWLTHGISKRLLPE